VVKCTPLSVSTVWILLRHGLDQGFEKVCRDPGCGSLVQWDESELGSPVDGDLGNGLRVDAMPPGKRSQNDVASLDAPPLSCGRSRQEPVP
jgi:hypothetical protein